MLAAMCLALLLALTACGDRRSFDERYEDAGRTIENKARELDRNLADQEVPAQRPAEPAGPPPS